MGGRNPILFAVIVVAGLMSAFAPAEAKTTLTIIVGNGELQSFQPSTTVDQPQDLWFQWSTDNAGAVGGTWKVTNNANSQVVTGSAGKAPKPGHISDFTIPGTGPGSFLATTPSSTAVKYTVTVTATDNTDTPISGASASVTVTQVTSKQMPIFFGPNANFPDAELVSYKENIGVVPFTQIHFASATVTVKLVNHTDAPTDPMWLGINDFNALWRQTASVAVDSLKHKGDSVIKTVTLAPRLSAPQSQTPQEVQYNEWTRLYNSLCGVDLRALEDWRGPQAKAPVNDHRETYLYLGYHDSKPWQAGPPPADTLTCDDTSCVNVADIGRSIFRQLGCKSVGYAYFIGRNAQDGVFNAYGFARTPANGGQSVDYTPATKMEVASVSKVVTMLTALRSLDAHHIDIGSPMYKYLPSDWQSSLSSTVKKITFRGLLSQSSGIKDYGNYGNDYAGLKTFFTQPISTSANTPCPSNTNKINSNPINASDFTPCYSNFNFAIFRILIPKMEGFAEDQNQSTRPQTLADQYQQTAQKYVFNPVGRPGVACKPPGGAAASTYSFVYQNPGNLPGFDWGDTSLICGAAAWYLSVEDMGSVLLSLNKGDSKVLSPTEFSQTETQHLGWDKTKIDDFDLGATVHTGFRELEKNGGWSACAQAQANGVCTDSVSLSTAIAILGGSSTTPGFVGVLFVNTGVNATGVLEGAYNASRVPKP
jgi:CubicO group peptidase (beta-lactamase class C family)